MNQPNEDLDRLRDCVFTHFPGNGISRDGLATLRRIERRFTDSLNCQRFQEGADYVRINSRAEPAKFALFTLKNFLTAECFPNDERLTAVAFAGYLREAIPALESNCPALKEAS